MELYRLLRRECAGTNPFDGEGSFRFGGRWLGIGTRLCYIATHRSLAILEYGVNLDQTVLPPDLVIATLSLPESISIADVPALPDDWRDYPAPDSLRRIGDLFIREGKSALMRIPSVIVPEEDHVLLNPAHPHSAKSLAQHRLQLFVFDARLLAVAKASCTAIRSRSTP